MPTYNFTVRATDDLGAYADRDFSINVRNTIVDRYLLMNTGSDIYGSPNLSDWTLRPNASASVNSSYTNSEMHLNSKFKLMFLNGRWISYKFLYNNNPFSRFSYSDDGINWNIVTKVNIDDELVALNASDANHIGCLSEYDGKIWGMYFTTFNSSTGYITSSTTKMIYTEDGLNWYTVPNTSFVNSSNWYKITKVNDTFFYTGYPSSSDTNNVRKIYKSTNPEGTEWTTVTLPVSIGTDYRMVGVKYFNGMYIVMGNRTTYYTSVDGINWVARTMPTMRTNEYPYDIVYGNGRLVMTTMYHKSSSTALSADVSRVYVSVDGINWTASTFDPYYVGAGFIGSNGVIECVFSNGRFILTNWPYVSSSSGIGTGGLRVSYDGLTWTTVTSGLPTILSAIGVMNI